MGSEVSSFGGVERRGKVGGGKEGGGKEGRRISFVNDSELLGL